jgi:alpha-beta hydrolase superfamily lysophospholipase
MDDDHAGRTWQERVLGHVEHPEIYRELMIHSREGPIALSVWRPPDARCTVVFVPGTATHPLFYEEFLNRLAAERCAVVGVHLGGHGKSPRSRRVLRWTTLVGNVVDAVAWATGELGLPVVLMGSSQGALVALLAAAEGTSVIGVVAHNVFDPNDPGSVEITRFGRFKRLDRQVRAALRGGARLAPRMPVPILAYLERDRVFSSPATAELFDADPLNLRSYPLRLLADLLSADTTGLYDGRLGAPVVVLAGRGDRLFPLDRVRAAASRLVAPQVDVVVVDADCHLILNEALASSVPPVLAAIDAFLARSAGGLGGPRPR